MYMGQISNSDFVLWWMKFYKTPGYSRHLLNTKLNKGWLLGHYWMYFFAELLPTKYHMYRTIWKKDEKGCDICLFSSSKEISNTVFHLLRSQIFPFWAANWLFPIVYSFCRRSRWCTAFLSCCIPCKPLWNTGLAAESLGFCLQVQMLHSSVFLETLPFLKLCNSPTYSKPYCQTKTEEAASLQKWEGKI